MTDSIGIDLSGLDRLQGDLTGAAVKVGLLAPKVVAKGAHNVMTEARALAPSGPHTRGYARSITYEVEFEGRAVSAVVGPEEGGQGSLGHLLEYGAVRSGPHPHLGPALDNEEPRFVKAVADLIGEVL